MPLRKLGSVACLEPVPGNFLRFLNQHQPNHLNPFVSTQQGQWGEAQVEPPLTDCSATAARPTRQIAAWVAVDLGQAKTDRDINGDI